MIFQFPKHNLSLKYLKIYNKLNAKGILGKYGPRFTFPDEPQFFQYACERSSGSKEGKTGFGFGCSDNESEAFKIAVAEAIEHYCILFEQSELFIHDSYENLESIALNPLRFVPFSKKQLRSNRYKKFRLSHKTFFNWLEGYSLTQKRKVLVPASLVYANYSSINYGEPIIQLGISTGAACGESLEFALYRGICEIIERDAYTISFIQKIPKRLINVENNKYLSTFKRRIERYNLEVYFLNTQLDCSPATVTCIIIDRSGSGPAVCTGLGGDLDTKHAIKTAGLEAVRRHISARDRFFRTKPLPMPAKNSFDWFLLQKQLLWSSPHMIKSAELFLSGISMQFKNSLKKFPKEYSKKVDFLVEELKIKGYEVIYVDVTPPSIRDVGFYVTKVLIPEMVPLWRDERYPYLGIQRLYDIPNRLGIKKTRFLDYNNVFSFHPF